MNGVPVAPRRVFGVDFSGARDAGRKIWLCRAHPGADGIRVESVDRLAELPGGGRRLDEALRALVQKVLEAPRSAWGFDFPFAVPVEVMPPAAPQEGVRPRTSWDMQLDAVAALGDAEAFRDRCRREGRPERRRRTDRETGTPWSGYNLRLYRQTFHGMTGVLRPLRAHSHVAVLPMDPLPGATGGAAGRLPHNVRAPDRVPHTYLLEVCPSSLLRELGWPRTGYKGRGEEAAARRRDTLRRLVEEGRVRPVERRVRARVLDDAEGDALDAVLAAVAAWRGYRNHDHGELRARCPEYATEGHVYC